MREAELVAAGGEALLPAVAVGDPEVGPVIAQEALEHPLAPARVGQKHRAVAVVHHPEPAVAPRHPEPGLVGGEHRARPQPVAQAAGLGGEGGGGRAHDAGERAFADLQPEDVAEHPFEPGEADVLAEAQVQRSARRFAPNGEPGAMPSGGAALKRRAHCGQVPPMSATRVTSGQIGGMSM